MDLLSRAVGSFRSFTPTTVTAPLSLTASSVSTSLVSSLSPAGGRLVSSHVSAGDSSPIPVCVSTLGDEAIQSQVRQTQSALLDLTLELQGVSGLQVQRPKLYLGNILTNAVGGSIPTLRPGNGYWYLPGSPVVSSSVGHQSGLSSCSSSHTEFTPQLSSSSTVEEPVPVFCEPPSQDSPPQEVPLSASFSSVRREALRTRSVEGDLGYEQLQWAQQIQGSDSEQPKGTADELTLASDSSVGGSSQSQPSFVSHDRDFDVLSAHVDTSITRINGNFKGVWDFLSESSREAESLKQSVLQLRWSLVFKSQEIDRLKRSVSQLQSAVVSSSQPAPSSSVREQSTQCSLDRVSRKERSSQRDGVTSSSIPSHREDLRGRSQRESVGRSKPKVRKQAGSPTKGLNRPNGQSRVSFAQRFRGRCYFCGKTGHRERDCFAKRKLAAKLRGLLLLRKAQGAVEQKCDVKGQVPSSLSDSPHRFHSVVQRPSVGQGTGFQPP